MNNILGPEIRDDQEDQLSQALTAENKSHDVRGASQTSRASNTRPYQFVILTNDESIPLAQKTLSTDNSDQLKMLPAFVICANQHKPAENDEDVTESFIAEFNAHRGNQEKLSQARRMLQKTRSLAGLELNLSFVDIPSARRNFFLLAQLDHQELKMAALENLILILQLDQLSKQTAFDLIDLAIDLMKQMDRQLIQTQLIDQQVKICQAYGMVAELIQWHYGKKHIGGITTELKRQLLLTLDTLKDLNTHDDSALNFAASYALEGFKRLKDDRKELFELLERGFHLLVGIVEAYRNSNYDYMHELMLAFKDIDIRIKQSWYDASSIFNGLVRTAHFNPNMLLVALSMFNENWKDLSWKFTYNTLQKLGDIVIHGTTPEIRLAAFQGEQYQKKQLLGLIQFLKCDEFKIKVSRKPMVHLKPPVQKDYNPSIRALVVEQLLRIIKECPDANIRLEAKKKLLHWEKQEKSSLVLNLINDAIPQDLDSKYKWLHETDSYQWKSKSNNSFSTKPQDIAVPILNPSSKTSDPFPISTTKPINISGEKNRRSTIQPSNPRKKSSRSASSSPKAKEFESNEKKVSQVEGRKKSKASHQSVLLAKYLNMSPDIVDAHIEFNQDIHLGDDSVFFINKAGMKKIVSLIEHQNATAILDFSQCKIQEDGLKLLIKNLDNIQISELHWPAGLDKSMGSNFTQLFKNEKHIRLEFASSEDDLLFGSLLVESGFISDGINYYRKALNKLEDIDNDSLKGEIYHTLGKALLVQEEDKKAEQNLLKAYRHAPLNRKYSTTLAKFYNKRENSVDAIRFAEVALSSSETSDIELDHEELKAILNKQIGKNKS